MTGPAPACPLRSPRPLGALAWARAAWDNSAAIWWRGAFVEPIQVWPGPARKILVPTAAPWVRQVLTSRAGSYEKGATARRAIAPLIGDALFIAEGEEWRRQRHLFVPLLTHRSRLPDQVRRMVPAIDEGLDRWLAAPGGVLALEREATRLAADVMGRTLFDFALAPHGDLINDAFIDYQDSLGRPDLTALLGLPDWLPRPGARRGRAAAARLAGLADQVLAVPAGTPDGLLAHLRQAGSQDPRQTGQMVRDQITMLLLAGHETTANTLCWAFYLLSRYPEARARLEAEAEAVLGARLPELGDLERLPYTRALIDETLRLYPPIHMFSREPLEPDQFGRHGVPLGSLVVIAPWLLHRHHRYWRDPDQFRPERFLEPGGRPRSRYAYIPFGAGTRVCPGASFALTELTLILALASRRMRLHLRPGHPVEPLGRLTLRPRQGLPMQLERRT